MARTAGTAELAAALAERADASLTALLEERPDLAVLAPSSLTSLAARAGSRPSLERALRRLSTPELLLARALGTGAARATSPEENRAPDPAGGPAENARRGMARLEELGLTVKGVPVANLPDLLAALPDLPETAEPPEPPRRTVPAEVAGAEGARAAEEVVRLVALLLETWQARGAVVLRTGGVGVRELRRTAAALDVDERTAAFVAELAAMSGLLGQEGEEQVAWVPARTAVEWLADPLPLRWARLARAWSSSARVPWLVGTREEGRTRAALEPTLERGWAAGLRRRLLDALATLPPETAPSAADWHALLSWERPLATPSEQTIAAVLDEATRLGLLGAGALTGAGRVLACAPDAGPATEPVLAEALEAELPEPVTELLVQGDLTAVVPGRPEPELAALLEVCAEIESRGSGLTVRFTPASVLRALDAGISDRALLDRLAGYSRTPLPQALEYLVRDTARRHGQVRVGAASSYLLVEDPALVAQLTGDPALASLGLSAPAPTVLLSTAPPGEVLRALRAAGLAPVVEGGEDRGAVAVRRRPRPVASLPGAEPQTYRRRPEPDELRRLVTRLRAGEEQVRRDVERRSDEGPVATDPVHALELLRLTAAAGETVEITLIGALGAPETRRVRPLSVEGGRVRVADVERDTELTVAVHRISSVSAIS